MKIFLFLLISTFMSACSTQAQGTTFILTGTVTNTVDGKPMPGAHVQLTETYLTTITNTSGQFAFKNLKPGKYSLRISYVGFQTTDTTIIISQNQQITIRLVPSVITTEEIIIRASRADEKTPGSHLHLDADWLMEKQNGTDIPFLLDLTPSMVSTSDAGAGIGYTGLRIRGTDISRINVTINGVPLNDPESHSVYWVNLPDLAGSVDNIQIQRGVGTSSNGAAAFGGSIHIQTVKLTPEPFAEIFSNAGSFSSFSNSVRFGTGLLHGRFTFDGRLSAIQSDGYIDRAFSDLKSYFFNAAYYDEKNIIRFTMLGGSEQTYLAWEGVPKDSLSTNRTLNPFTYENETDNYQQYHYHINFMRQQSRKLSFNATGFFVSGNGYYEQFKEYKKLSSYGLSPIISGNDTILKSDIIQQKHLDNIFYGVNLTASYNSFEKTKISGGVSANHFTNDHFGKIKWMQYAFYTPVDFRWYSNQGNKTDIAAFVICNYDLSEKIRLYGDILLRSISYRLEGTHDDLRDITQNHNFNFINPKAGIFYSFDNANEVYGSFSVANREPSRNDFRDADENSVILPERLLDYEAGYNYKTKIFLVKSNIFYMDYRDQLVLTGKINNVGDPVMVNVPESYRAGIELSGSIHPVSSLEIDANVSVSRNRIKDFTEWVDNWDTGTQVSNDLGETEISFSPSVVSGAEIRFSPVKNLRIAFTSKYVGKQFIDNTSSDQRKLDPWLVNNFRLAVHIPGHFWKEADLRLTVFNIFNSMYESNAWVYRYVEGGEEKAADGYFPQAGRHFMLGLHLKF